MLVTLAALSAVLLVLLAYYLKRGRPAQKATILTPEAPIVELATLSTTAPPAVNPVRVLPPVAAPVPAAAPAPVVAQVATAPAPQAPRPAARPLSPSPAPAYAAASPYGQASVQRGVIGFMGSADEDPAITWRVARTDDYFDLTEPTAASLAPVGTVSLGADRSTISWSGAAD